jgi:hypothetical protein
MKIPTPGFLFAAFGQVARRFPGALLCAILGSIACFALIDSSSPRDEQGFFTRNWMICQLGLPFLSALVAYSESKGWEEKRSWILQFSGVLALLAYWFWLDPNADDFERVGLPRYLVLVLVAHLMVAVAPYLNARPVRDFWEYNRQIFANITVGLAFTLILYTGLALAILAVDNLFGINLEEKLYAKLYVLLVGIFNTLYFLFHFPRKFTFESESGAYSWVFRNLCKYILIPISLLYFIILYAYGAKIGLEWSLPKGWVSSLVIGFSVAGIFTYLLNFYLSEEDNSPLVRGFKRWFWWVLLPLTGMLFIAIGKRIGDYGVTEQRFLVAELGVWLAVTCLYFLFSKNDNLKFIPISLALFALAWAFGPLNAFSVSERSQRGILTNILSQNGCLESGILKPCKPTLTDPEFEQVQSTIQFLERRNALADLLPQPLDSTLLEYNGLMTWLGLEQGAKNAHKSLYINASDLTNSLNIKGFDTAYKIDLSPGNMPDRSANSNYFGLSQNGQLLEYWQQKDGKSTLVESYSLNTAIQMWSLKIDHREDATYAQLPIQERSIELAGKRASLRLIVEELEIILDSGAKRLNYCHGWVLVKEK